MPDAPRPIDQLTGTFIATLRRLGAAGEPEAASRLAAQAWVALRHDEPRLAERVNGVMHHLARLEAGATASERGPDDEEQASDADEDADDEG